MLEAIVMIIVFSKSGSILQEKGWKKTLGWEFLGILVYVLSLMLGGALYGAIAFMLTGSIEIDSFLVPYLCAYAVAFLGVFLYFKLLRSFPSREQSEIEGFVEAP